MNGIERIRKERERQQAEEGWTANHDDGHHAGDLAMAANAYAYQAVALQGDWVNFPRCGSENPPRDWPWTKEWWKPSDDPIRNLEKAGALIAAEIDRLLRLARESEGANHEP